MYAHIERERQCLLYLSSPVFLDEGIVCNVMMTHPHDPLLHVSLHWQMLSSDCDHQTSTMCVCQYNVNTKWYIRACHAYTSFYHTHNNY